MLGMDLGGDPVGQEERADLAVVAARIQRAWRRQRAQRAWRRRLWRRSLVCYDIGDFWDVAEAERARAQAARVLQRRWRDKVACWDDYVYLLELRGERRLERRLDAAETLQCAWRHLRGSDGRGMRAATRHATLCVCMSAQENNYSPYPTCISHSRSHCKINYIFGISHSYPGIS